MHLNIVFLAIVDMSSNTGGAIHIRELVKNWQKSDAQVHLLAYANHPNYSDPYIPLFHNVGYLYQKRNLWQVFRLTFSFFKMLSLSRKYVKQAHILYGRSEGFAGILLVLLKTLWNPKAKTVFEANGLVEEFSRLRNSWDRLYKPIYVILENMVIKRVESVIAVTPQIKDVLAKRHKVDRNKIHVVGNGAETDKFYPVDKASLQEMRRKLQIMPDDFVIGYVGSLVRWQGIDYLVAVAPRLAKEIPKVRFLIVGSGTAEEELKRMVSASGMNGKFIFTGVVPHDEVAKYINLCDICVTLKRKLSSGFSPLKLYEYLACGKPVIATDFAGFDVLEKNKMGLLVNPEDGDELIWSILKLFRDVNLRVQMGRNGREYVIQNCSWAVTAERVLGVCQSLVSSKQEKG